MAKYLDGTGLGILWDQIKNTFALSGHNHDSAYVKIDGSTKMTGPLTIQSSINNNYNEGIRIEDAGNKWAGITLGAVGTSGITPQAGEVAWFIAKRPGGGFIISPNSSSNDTGLHLTASGDIKWRTNVMLHLGNYTSYCATANHGHSNYLPKAHVTSPQDSTYGDSNTSWAIDYAASYPQAFVYNSYGAEYSYLIGMNSNNNYGTILKMGYADKYLRILRKSKNSWQSTDWEKISAGYADSAGSVAWDNITSKPDSFTPSTHDHDGRYIKWAGSAADTSAMAWGTLTTANGYTILSHTSSSDGGDWGMVNKGGQIFMQLDGYYYQNEGQYRVLDTSDSSSFAPSNHTHSYIPLSGGAITGQITRDSGGGWIRGRDTAIIKTTRTDSNDWHPAVAVKTSVGCWSFGSVGGETLALSYDTDEDYSNSRNNSAVIWFPTAGSSGTLALTSDITAAVGSYLPLSGGTMTGTIKYGGASYEIIRTGGDDTSWRGGLKYSWSSNTTIALWGKHTKSQFVWHAGSDFSTSDVNGTTTRTYDFQIGRNGSDVLEGLIGGNLILHAGNYTSYTVKKDGMGASGTWGISITGNATTANGLSSTAISDNTDFNTLTSPGRYHQASSATEGTFVNAPAGRSNGEMFLMVNLHGGDAYLTQTYFDRSTNGVPQVFIRPLTNASGTVTPGAWKRFAYTDDNVASANYATSAGEVSWSNVSGKPINFKAYSGSLASGGWKTMQGKDSSPSIAISYNSRATSWNSGTYSATLVYGCSDTRGLLDCAYNTPLVTFGGCSYGGSDDNNPTWYMKLSGTSGTTYDLNFMPYATRARYLQADNDASSPGGALLRSGSGRADASPGGDTWIFWDELGGTSSYWGIRHNQANNSIGFCGAGSETSSIDLQTGKITSKGFILTGSSSSYVLLGDGSTKAVSDFATSNHTHSNYLERLTWWNSQDSHSVDSLTTGTTFAYTSHSAPTNGTIAAFSCNNGTYALQLQGQYNGENLWFRNKNGDNGTWNTWRYVIHSGNIGSQSVAYANSAGSAYSSADTVDGYHASDLWRSDGGVWNPSANITLGASANGQEWSFDISRNGYTGCYWHVWDSSGGTMLSVTPDDGKVRAPYGFVGNLEGTATYATSAGTSTSAGSATTAESATYASSYLANRQTIGTGSQNHAQALQSYFDSYKSSIPRNCLTANYSGAYGNGSLYFGYFLSGYDSNPYGGFYVCHYDTPYYVGISYGSYHQQEIITSSSIGSQSVNYANSAGAVAWDNITSKPSSFTPATHDHDGTYLKLTGGTLTGALVLQRSGGTNNYNEGIRFNLSGPSSWAGFTIGGTAEQGTGDGIWAFLVNNKTFYIGHNGSSTATYGLTFTNAGALNLKTSSLTNNGNAIITSANIGDQSVNYASSSGKSSYIEPQSYTPTSDTVGGHKAGLANWLNTDSSTGIGKNVIISESIIRQWDNDNAKPYPSSVYAMIKIGGGYNYTTYGQWLLSSYNQTRLGVVGRTQGEWSSIKWLANTDDLAEKQNTISDLATIRSGAALGATAVQPATLSNYLERLTWWNSQDSHSVDSLTTGTTFAYTSHSAPTNGTIAAFSCNNGTYALQLQGQYNGENLWFRNKNGDNGTWNTWRYVIHSGNIGSQTVSNSDKVDGKHDGELTAQYFSAGARLTSNDSINRVLSGVYSYINADNPTGSIGNNCVLVAFRDQSRTDNLQIVGAGNEQALYYRIATNVGDSTYETWTGWRELIHSGNIGSQSVASATNADTVDGYHASDLVKFYLSPMSSGAPADSAKSWFVNTMPSSSGAIVYNVPGSEKTIIAGKSSGSYGHMLQLNYDDNYLRILRYQGGGWKTTDWEKISAGNSDALGGISASGFVRQYNGVDKDFNIPDGGSVSGVYYVHSSYTQSNYPERYGILADFNADAGHLQFFGGGNNNIKVRSYWWTSDTNFSGYSSWVDLIHSGNIASSIPTLTDSEIDAIFT